jgi:hypothetical protein
MKNREYSWPNGHWDWYQHLAFKHGIRVGDLMFVGGQVDKTDQGEPLNADEHQVSYPDTVFECKVLIPVPVTVGPGVLPVFHRRDGLLNGGKVF